MLYGNESAAVRRERLRQEGKIELPLNVDTRKYLLSFVRWKDVLISLPLLIAAITVLYILYQMGIKINSQNVIICFTPWVVFLVLLTIQHPDRKNISFLEHRIVWRAKYNRRQKLFTYSKGDSMSNSKSKSKGKKEIKDIRDQLGISNIYSDCYETNDKRLVKVIKVSSINLSLSTRSEEEAIYKAYETFLNDCPEATLQINLIAQPVNLKNYALYIKERTANEQDTAKRLLSKSYLDFVSNIEKSRNMVSRNRYLIISRPFTEQNREKVLDELDRDTKILLSQIENMLGGRYQLKGKILNNEELHNLIYTCIDYENAQVNMGFLNTSLPITVGEQTYNEMKARWEKEKMEKII